MPPLLDNCPDSYTITASSRRQGGNLMDPGYMWLVFALILLILEALTPGTFFMASLAIGSLVAATAAFLLPTVWWLQWIVFCIVTTLCVFISRHLVQRFDTTPSVPMNVDALVGKPAVVVQAIDAPGQAGRVRVESQEWRACAERDIPEGERVEVKEVRGNRLLVG
ncbi:MAG: hypothetical protein COS85_12535 [Armatimonadetes bacterium CG07_land_8_20_14_0_80_59_28]|nr:MAG: hypothetical protein COS85_12535 [Armatimonadetes bacterium CG07_land_8_20_14_0_80_59_28]PIX45653.1 MAG: hypothetical protein COZ56_01405 [Armatimonadetes bacterium CG_4_8_14_3_um_filter_58_9]PIY41006.1 MAG: hypothetical protein COZ05_16415 [Armatimonadetes bacterium CG_4_10_14_3_um_filter_59_10]